MASQIHIIFQKYKKQVEQMMGWLTTSEQKQKQSKYLSRFGQLFLETILLKLTQYPEIDLIKLSQKKQKQKELLKKIIKDRHNVDQKFIQLALGMYFRDLFKLNETLTSIVDELQLKYSYQQQNQACYSHLDDISTIINSQQAETSGYETCQYIQFIKELNSSNIQTCQPQTTNKDNQKKQILQYLIKIGSPASQLTYLTQHFNWRLNYQTKQIINNNKFQVKAIVNFSYKKINNVFEQSFQMNTKKKAKACASLKMLKLIYISFPQIWEMYQQVRQQKNLQLPSDDMTQNLNATVISSSPITLPAILLKSTEPVDKKQVQQRDQFIQNINNFKTELNYISQHNSNSVSVGKYQKTQNGLKWLVKGQVVVKSKQGDRIYKQTFQNTNSKAAQQVIAKALVRQIYSNHKQILNKMMNLRTNKKI